MSENSKNEQNMPFKAKEVYCDIDGTLTNETEGFGPSIYAQRTPKKYMIEYINHLFNKGHKITLWSARHLEDEEDTIIWLKKYGVKYHKLILGKPKYELLIDDLAINPKHIKALCNGKI